MKKYLILFLFVSCLNSIVAQSTITDTIITKAQKIYTGQVSVHDENNYSVRTPHAIAMIPKESVEYVSYLTEPFGRRVYFKDGLAYIIPKNKSSKAEYFQVIQMEGVSKDQLYLRAKEWFVSMFNYPNSILKIDEREDGRLVGRAITSNFTYSYALVGYNVNLNFLISVELREGRYKYSIYDIYFREGSKIIYEDLNGVDLAQDIPKWQHPNDKKKKKLKIWNSIRNQANTFFNTIELSLISKIYEEVNTEEW